MKPVARWMIFWIVWCCLTPFLASAHPLAVESLPLDESELRLILAERNLGAVRTTVGENLSKSRLEDRSRIQERFLALREPTENAARRHRQAALTRLERFAAAHTAGRYASEVLLRIAILQMEQADDDYMDQMHLYMAALDADAQEVPEPRRDYDSAIETLQHFLEQYPKGKNRELAWYLVGYAFLETNEREEAVAAFGRVLQEKTSGPIRTEILVRIGDYFFDENELEPAEFYYRRAVKSPGSWKDRALYKWAWTLYRMDRHGSAMAAFTELADMGDERPDLLDETMRYMAITYVEGWGLEEALEHMQDRGARSYDDQLLRSIADVLHESTDFAAAVSAYTIALRRFPLHPENLRIARARITALHYDWKEPEALHARRVFAEDYSPGSPWYGEHADHPDLLREADKWSERYLHEYSTYHHEQEQQGNVASSQLAEEGYRMYLERFSDAPRALQIHFYLAELLYERAQFAEAMHHYREVAQSAPDPTTGAALRSAYNMVLSARKLYDENAEDLATLLRVSHQFVDLLPTHERAPLVLYHAGRLLCEHERHDDCRDELSRMIERYPSSPLAVEAIRTVIDSYGRQERYGELARWADRLLERGQPADPEAHRYVLDMVGGAMFREAMGHDKGGEADKAAARYLEVHRRYPTTQAGIAALFNAAYSFERAGQSLKAVQYYADLLEKHPDAKFAARAGFRKGQIFEKALAYPRAISAYSQVYTTYGESAEAQDALYNVAALSAELQEHERSAQAFDLHWDYYGERLTGATESLLRAGVQWELAGNHREAAQRFFQYARRPDQSPRAAYAMYRGGLLVPERNRTAVFEDALRLAEAHEERSGESDWGTVAAVRFELAEIQRKAYVGLRIPADLSALLPALEAKAAGLQRVRRAYTQVVQAGDPDLAIAALYRIGEAHARFADALFEAPLPPGLDDVEADIYRFELEERAMPIEDQAYEAYGIAARRAQELEILNEWTGRIQRALDEKPTRVGILTDGLEAEYLVSVQQPDTPVTVSLDTSQRSGPKVTVDRSGDGVPDQRMDNLLHDSVSRMQTFMDADEAFLARQTSKREER